MKFKKLYIYLILVLASLLLPAALLQLNFVSHLKGSLENLTYDLRFQLRYLYTETEQIEEITVIDIDDKSIEKLGRFSSWPLIYFADALEYLMAGGAKAALFDIFFTRPTEYNELMVNRYLDVISRQMNEDTATIKRFIRALNTMDQFSSVINKVGNVYLPAYDNPFSEDTSSIIIPDNMSAFDKSSFTEKYNFHELTSPQLPVRPLIDSAYKIGFAHIYPDDDGFTRTYNSFFEYGDKLLINFSFQLVIDLLGVDSIDITDTHLTLRRDDEIIRKLPVNDEGRIPINYYGPRMTFRYISFSDILLKRIDNRFFKDKIIFFGSSATSLKDLKMIPLDYNYPGVELHTTFIHNVLSDRLLGYLTATEEMISLIIFTLLTVLLYYRSGLLIVLLGFPFIILTVAALSVYLFIEQSIILNSSLFVYYSLFTFGIVLIYRYKTDLSEKKKVKKTFSKYVSPYIIDDMLNHPEKLKLGGEVNNVTALFSDIRNFTSMSEQWDPSQLIEFLKVYMTRLSGIIIENKGMLDKYIGDAIVALFGVPVKYEEHAAAACIAALKMQEAEKDIYSRFSKLPHFTGLSTGIGINTGEMTTGNMGSEQLFDYTGIGDNMNLASRLESLNKYYKTQILISDTTRTQLNDDFIVRELDRIMVKGKKKPITVFNLIAEKKLNSINNFEKTTELIERYEKALGLYYEGSWKDAAVFFENLLKDFPDDHPSAVMLERSQSLFANPPQNWQGVHKMTEK